jgi:circadian clock protein KaiC
MKRISSGIPTLDRKIEGGFPENTVILVSGGPGSGKTLFGLNFLLEGARKGEKCCYISFNEKKEDILRACEGIKQLSELVKYTDKNLQIMHVNFNNIMTLDRFVDTLDKYPQIDRMVIDNVNKLLMFAENSISYRRQLCKIIEEARKTKVAILICETKKDDIDTGRGESFECDGVINLSFLEYGEKPMRMLTIHKMRFTAFDPLIPNELIIKDRITLGKAKIM